VSSVSKEFTVSLLNLEIALQWLIRNNKLYKSVKIQMPNNEPNVGGLVIYSTPVMNYTNIPPESHDSVLPIELSVIGSAFNILNDDTSILHSMFHQGHPRFGSIAGIQCTAIATVAVVMGHIKQYERWVRADIDTALLTGSRYYSECVSHRSDNNASVYLMASDLLPHIEIARQNYNIMVIADLVVGTTIHRPSVIVVEGMTYSSLLNGLTAFFNEADYGVLTVKEISLAIAHQNGKYWLIDSHSRGPKGFVAARRGLAMVMSFLSIHSFSHRILVLTRSNKVPEQYVIAKIEVTQNPENTGNIDSLHHPTTPIDNELVNMNHFSSTIESGNCVENNDDIMSNNTIEVTALMNIDVPIPNVNDILDLPEDIPDSVPVHNLKRKCAPPVSALIEKRAEELAWYHLFPTGENGFMEDRPVPITALDYFQSRFMGEDSRFQRIDYLFYALSMVELFRARSNISVCGRLQQNGVQATNLINNLHLSMRQIRGTSS